MDFNWNEPRTIDEQQFSADNLGRAKYATYLTSLIKAKGGTDKNNLSNYVLNLDAEWGAGKTYFLKRWSEDLRGNHPVVYIDAWSIDYLESPLMTVLSEIIEQLKTQTDRADSPIAKAKFKEIIKAAAPRVGSALIKRYLGFDFDVLNSSEAESENSSNKEIDFSKAGEKVLEVFCKEVKDSKESVKTLKLAIQAWVEYVVYNPVKGMGTVKNSYPAFIFIDELDRCKPTYAVEMLEAIKHVFDISGLVFIVATNSSQLAHTVRAVYGPEFNAEGYLSRFFNNRYYLKTEVSKELIKNHCSIELINQDNLKNMQVVLFPFVDFDIELFLDFCVKVFDAADLTPRQAVKVFDRIQLAVLNLKASTCINVAVMIVFFTLQEKSLKMLDDFFIFIINTNQLQALRDKYNSFVEKFIGITLKFPINMIQIRNEYHYIDTTPRKFETQNDYNHNIKDMNLSLYQLFGISFKLGTLQNQEEIVNNLLERKNPSSLQTEFLKFYMLLMQIRDQPIYYQDLTNMAVNLD